MSLQHIRDGFTGNELFAAEFIPSNSLEL